MTPAPELRTAPGYAPTGNLQVHLPANRIADAAVERVGVVHLGVNGVLDLAGTDGAPLIAPVLHVDGERVVPTDVTERHHWVPVWQYQGSAWHATVTLLAPHGERGFALRLHARAETAVTIELRIETALAGLEAVRFRNQPLAVGFERFHDPWTRTVVWHSRTPIPLVALAVHLDDDWSIQDRGAVDWMATQRLEVQPGTERCATAYFGVAVEGDGARTTALHLRRVGWAELLGRTEAWLQSRAVRAPAGLERLTNRNLFFSYFYAQADTIDTGTPVMLTSRSLVYYVSGAFWSRDALLWAFPAILVVDPARARALLREAFVRYARHPGDHAQYLNGEVLYPGFELDEAAAYPFALARYVAETGDRSVADDPVVRDALLRTLDVIRAQRHPTRALYRTFLSPTDDPVGDTPYLAFDNFLLAAALKRLGGTLGDATLEDWGAAVEHEAIRSFRVAGPYGDMYAFAVDEAGRPTLGDEPAGSLLLLPYLGSCAPDDPVWLATARWVRSHHNPFHFEGRFSGRGSAHFPHPSVFGVVNDLLSDRVSEAHTVLRSAPLDNGLACEGFDVDHGAVRTGGAFASLAGWLAYALDRVARAGEAATTAS
jgi:uncharacterized protein